MLLSRTLSLRSTSGMAGVPRRDDAGVKVTVICPNGAKQDRARAALIEGVLILRYLGGGLRVGRSEDIVNTRSRCTHAAPGQIKVRREETVDIVHACTLRIFCLIAVALKPAAPVVFDHHDLGPRGTSRVPQRWATPLL